MQKIIIIGIVLYFLFFKKKTNSPTSGVNVGDLSNGLIDSTTPFFNEKDNTYDLLDIPDMATTPIVKDKASLVLEPKTAVSPISPILEMTNPVRNIEINPIRNLALA